MKHVFEQTEKVSRIEDKADQCEIGDAISLYY